MKLRPLLAAIALCLPLLAAPGCESFYGYTDGDGNPVPAEVRQADAQARLDALTDRADALASALDTVLAERDALEARIDGLNIQLDLLREAGADTSEVDRALAVAEEAIAAVADYAEQVAAKSAEVSAAMESIQTDIDDGTLGGASVPTVAVLEGGARVAPLAGPYGEIISVALLGLAGLIRHRGKQVAKKLEAERDEAEEANRGLVDSVDALLDSDLIDDGNGGKSKAKRILKGTQNPAAKAAVRRILSGK